MPIRFMMCKTASHLLILPRLWQTRTIDFLASYGELCARPRGPRGLGQNLYGAYRAQMDGPEPIAQISVPNKAQMNSLEWPQGPKSAAALWDREAANAGELLLCSAKELIQIIPASRQHILIYIYI